MDDLKRAVDDGDVEKVRTFTSKSEVNNHNYTYKGTILHYACEQGCTAAVRVLVSEFEADLTISNKYGDTPLHCACEKGQLNTVEVLISEFNADLSIKNQFGCTPLHCACEKSQWDVVRLFVTKFKADLSIQDHAGRTPFHYACGSGKLDVVKLMMSEFKGDLDVCSKVGNTPLHDACEQGHLDVARVLVTELKADLSIQNQFGRTPLDCACWTLKLKFDVASAVGGAFKADLSMQDSAGRTLLHSACERGLFSAVKALTLDFKAGQSIQDKKGHTVMHTACMIGNLDIVKFLMSKFSADLSIQDTAGYTPLMLAIKSGHDNVVLALLCDYQCPVADRDYDGWGVLHHACARGSVDLVKALIHERQVDINLRNKSNETPFQLALNLGRTDIALSLILDFGCDPNMEDKEGQTLLHYACKSGDFDLVKILIHECQVDINRLNKSNETPFQLALNLGRSDIALSLILDFGCDPNTEDKQGQTLLHKACKNGDIDLVRALAGEYKADVNTCLKIALNYGRFSTAFCLISEFKSDPNVVNDIGFSLLYYACKKGDLDQVCALVRDHKADINLGNKQITTTPLHAAVNAEKYDVVQFLVGEFGCDLNATNLARQTPLHCACYKENLDIVKALVRESDVHACDRSKRTPFQAAAAANNYGAILVLCENGCDLGALNRDITSLLFDVCKKKGHTYALHALVRQHKADVHALNEIKITPLHVAANSGNHEVVLALINEYGCDPNAQGDSGRTPLHYAVQEGHHDVVYELLKFTSPLVRDEDGNTPLHLASKTSHYLTIRCLLNANAPVLVRNNNGKTPLDLATAGTRSILQKHTDVNILAEYDELSRCTKKKYSGSDYITRVFVLGNPGAGKSSFIESLKRESFFQSFNKVSESSVPPHTAGIIPSVHTSKQYGRVLFYDFAGDAEYYSSHAAIFESLASSRKGNNIFIVVVDLRKDDATVETTLHYWFSFIQYQKFSNASFLVVGSHLDQSAKQSECLQKFCTTMQPNVHNIKHFMLDCRDPRSNQIAVLKKQIFTWVSESQKCTISQCAGLLLGLLEKDFNAVTACPVQTLISHIKQCKLCLPVLPEALYRILLELHEVGVLMLLGDCTKDSDHVILNITKLTNEVHQLLFAESFYSKLLKEKEKLKAASFNIGILPEKLLNELLPPYITVECLIHLQYCQKISNNDIRLFPSLKQDDSTNQSYLFFPALCSVDKSQVSWDESTNTFGINWLALCTDPHDYFPPRFLHVLLLRLVYGFTLSPAQLQTAQYASPEHSRRCTMWKNGVHWWMEEGVECMVELIHGSQGVVVLTKTSMDRAENCVGVFTRVVSCVMEAKAEFCHSTKPEFFLLDSSAEADYLNEDHQFAVSEVVRALECPEGKPVIISLSGTRTMEVSMLQWVLSFTLWNLFFPLKLDAVLHTLKVIVREIFDLGLRLNAPFEFLDSLRVNFPSDVDQRRIQLMKWWIKNSPQPPCWYTLVEALKDVERSTLAEEIREKHGLHIELQEKLLCKESQAEKPDTEFLHSFSAVVGSRWPSLAVPLALSEEEIEGLKGKVGLSQQEIALQMLTTWASRSQASYSQLCSKLKTISLFQGC